MQTVTPLFGVNLANVPIINLRQEFQHCRRLFGNDEFRDGMSGHQGEALSTDYGAYVTPAALQTHVVQRSVMGIESYLPFAVVHEAGLRKVLTRETFERASNPFSFGGKSTVANYYHRLPALVAPECSLRAYDAKLYETTNAFYREIRNPPFHGHEIQNDDRGAATHSVMEYIASLYAWIDRWCPPSDLWKKSREEESTAPTSAQSEGGRVTLHLRIPTLRDP